MLIYRFRNCLLNTIERSVIKGDQYVELTTKTFDVLLYLIENAGNIVTKDDLLGAVWSGNFVEESNLPVHISKLRRSLGQGRGERYIETVQGVGYRFVAPLQPVAESEWRFTVARLMDLINRSALQAVNHSLAILPFVNDSPDTGIDYLIDGLTEGLINALSPFGNISVIGRDTVFRFKGTIHSSDEICKLLGASHTLTGRVRLTGETLVVSVSLMDSAGIQIWGSQYSQPAQDLIPIQHDTALSVADALSATPVKKHSVNPLTQDSESYRLYLKGRYWLERHTIKDIYRGIRLLEQSVNLDPRNVYANVEIFECYRILHMYDHISYTEFLDAVKPLQNRIDARYERLDAVQLMYCDLRMLEWKFDEAIEHCKKALAINPTYPKACVRYSELLMQSRKYGEALEQLQKIVIIDPLSSLVHKRIGRLFYTMGEHDRAIVYINDALDLDGSDLEALALRGAVHLEKLELEAALKDFKAFLKHEYHVEILALTGVVYALQGNRTRAMRIIDEIKEKTKESQHSIMLAYLYFTLGEKEKGYFYLEKAVVERQNDLRALTYDPRWKPFRTEPRFKALTRKIGLPVFED